VRSPAIPTDESRIPNPDAIAWYVSQAEAVLDDLRERVQSLRSRASQLAGFTAAVVALVGGSAERILAGLISVGVALGIFIIEVTF